MTTLFYDGTFDGFLSAVFEVYAHKLDDARIRRENTGQSALFGSSIQVATDSAKASRVWNGLLALIPETAARHFFYNILSEESDAEDNMLGFARHVFDHKADMSKDFGNTAVLRVSQTAKKVGREKHRMEAFVRFQLSPSGVYHAVIEPDFNVISLIINHFQSRYADQHWMIWDSRRAYGIYYNLNAVEFVYESGETPLAGVMEVAEPAYAHLWRTYFKSTNIAERKNLKLHKQHVPLRYWKYLCEKQPGV